MLGKTRDVWKNVLAKMSGAKNTALSRNGASNTKRSSLPRNHDWGAIIIVFLMVSFGGFIGGLIGGAVSGFIIRVLP